MSADEFTKLFSYMSRRFDDLEAKLEGKADKDVVYNQLDGIISRLADMDIELAIISNRLNFPAK